MNDLSFEFNSPMTKEDWDKLQDNEMEYTVEVTFKTPSGKRVPFRKVKHGEWVKKAEAFTNLYGETEYVVHGICSVCNQRQSFGDYPFCPWCGADMRERKETE